MRLLYSSDVTADVKGEIINMLLKLEDMVLEEDGQCMYGVTT